VAETDLTFGYDSAMMIATEAIDRLHTTASSHQRIILVDVMGHNAGWLALGSSLAGGADVCLIPEIPYSYHKIAKALESRRAKGRRFSIVAVAEGARQIEEELEKKKKSDKARRKTDLKPTSADLALDLERDLGMEVRSTTLGYIQRGGIPSPTDRLLATQLGVAAANLINEGMFGVMVAVKGRDLKPVALEKVAGNKKTIPLDHAIIETARLIGLCLGD
jgi:6-phosphofructokinase 1